MTYKPTMPNSARFIKSLENSSRRNPNTWKMQ